MTEYMRKRRYREYGEYKGFREFLRLCIERSGLTRRQLSQRMGYANCTGGAERIYECLHSQKLPSALTLVRLETALDLPLGKLYMEIAAEYSRELRELMATREYKEACEESIAEQKEKDTARWHRSRLGQYYQRKKKLKEKVKEAGTHGKTGEAL